MENLNTTPEETPEDVEKKTAEDLGINPETGETRLDGEMNAKFNQAEEPEDEMKEAA